MARLPVPIHSRREFIGALALGAGARAADAPFRFTRIDHVEFTVADVARSRDFYARLFGNAVLKNNRTERRYIQMGASYFAFEPSQNVRVDHISAGIAGYDVNALHDYLKQRNIAYRDFPSGKDLNVTDPDGIRLQLSVDEGWNQLTASTASPEAVNTGGALATPVGVDHILLNVTDEAKAAAFYARILGTVSEKTSERTWFQVGTSRLGFRKTPASGKPGVDHIAILAAFDASLSERLVQVGIKLDAGSTPASPEFRDPDGYLVQMVKAG